MPIPRSSAILCFALLHFSAFPFTPAWAQAAPLLPTRGDPSRGLAIYQGCMGCHSLDENDVGPKHRGVVGRRAASVPGYAYSPALRASRMTWNEANLDAWLADPQRLVPGTKMYFSVAGAQDRADIIAYLRTQRTQEYGGPAPTSVASPLVKETPKPLKPAPMSPTVSGARMRAARKP